MAGEKILIVDDEPEIIDFVKMYLLQENFKISHAFNGKEALQKVRLEKPELIVLDIMLPDIDGVELCLNIRKISDCPILFISCKSSDIDKVLALSAGGDDYLTKPFSTLELVARIKAHLRRNRMSENNSTDDVIKYDELEIHFNTHEVFVNEKQISLSAKEFDILSLLMKDPKRIYTVEQLYEAVWKENVLEGDSRTIIVYIGNIRKKIEPDPSNPKYILTVRGVGYKFNHNLILGGEKDKVKV